MAGPSRPPNPAWHEALKRGDVHYESDRPCKRGHIGTRYVKNDGCVTCVKAYSVEYARLHPRPKAPPKTTSRPPKVTAKLPPRQKLESIVSLSERARKVCLGVTGVDCSPALLTRRATQFYTQHLQNIAGDRDAVYSERFELGKITRPIQQTT